MFKKIIAPLEELQYQKDGFDIKYLINEGSRAIGMFAITKNMEIPAQISAQDVFFYVLEGHLSIILDDKSFDMKSSEALLIPKMTAYTIKMTENAKFMTARL